MNHTLLQPYPTDLTEPLQVVLSHLTGAQVYSRNHLIHAAYQGTGVVLGRLFPCEPQSFTMLDMATVDPAKATVLLTNQEAIRAIEELANMEKTASEQGTYASAQLDPLTILVLQRALRVLIDIILNRR